jgi:hypothetical protein
MVGRDSGRSDGRSRFDDLCRSDETDCLSALQMTAKGELNSFTELRGDCIEPDGDLVSSELAWKVWSYYNTISG